MERGGKSILPTTSRTGGSSFCQLRGLGGQEDGHEWLESALAAFLRRLRNEELEKGEAKKAERAGQRIRR